MFAVAVYAAAPANFAGTWVLDKEKSQGLSRQLQGADSVSWVVTQDDKQITVEQKVTGGNMSGGGGRPGGPGGAPGAQGGAPGAPGGSPGGPGGGGGRGGFGGPPGPRTYNLDGSDAAFEMGQAKGTRKATWSSDGKTLELSTKTTFQGPNGEVTSTSTEKLQLSSDGKSLTVTRHSESPRGPQDSTLAFNKQ